MTDYLVLRSDDVDEGITLRYALAIAIAWHGHYAETGLTAADRPAYEILAAAIGSEAATPRWEEEGDGWRVVADADHLSGFRLPSVAIRLLELLEAVAGASHDLARSDVQDALYAALVARLEREWERHRREAAAPYMTPERLAETLGVDPALVEGDAIGMLAIANTDPLPEGLPEPLAATLREGRRKAG